MFPVLLTVGKFSVTPIGISLLLALLLCLFVSWRVKQVYDLDAEKTLDIFFWTFIGGYITSRVYFVLFNLSQFDSLLKMISVFSYPGLSFWGALMGGFFAFALLCYRLKINFWQAADFAIPPIFLGVSITSLGCLLSGCGSGLPSDLPFAIYQVGLIGKRFPIQIIEAALFFVAFLRLYKKTLKFHFSGQIASMGLILLGVLKLILEPFRVESSKVFFIPQGYLWAILLIWVGLYTYYKKGRRSPKQDIASVRQLFTSRKRQKLVLYKLNKSWYDWRVNWRIRLGRKVTRLKKILNVKTTPTKYRQD